MSTATHSPQVMEVLRQHIESRYQRDLQALARMQELLVNEQKANPESGFAFSAPTHYDIITKTMRTQPNHSWTVPEISYATGLPQSAIRTVIYSRQDDFLKDATSPRRVRWRVLHNTE